MRKIASIFLFVGIAVGAQAQQMKLLAPRTGWFVASGGRLLWTSDNGAHWKDITPRYPSVPKGSKLSGVFFRDASEGWAIVSYPEPIAPNLEAILHQKITYSIAHTVNSGATWDAVPLSYLALPKWEQETIAGPGELYFLDSIHGWLVIGFSSNTRSGKLLVTEDGGKTWNWVNGPTFFAGQFFFSSLTKGWLLGTWDDDRLHVTHDGGKSWQVVSLKPPADVGAAIYPRLLELPVFSDSQHGYVIVHYSGPQGTSPKLVVYGTHSGGKSWQPLKTFPAPQYPPLFAISDSTVVLPTISNTAEPSTESVPLATPGQPARPVSASSFRAITAFSFLNRNDGWVIKVGSGLYATSDGGSTWQNISPPSPITASVYARHFVTKTRSLP